MDGLDADLSRKLGYASSSPYSRFPLALEEIGVDSSDMTTAPRAADLYIREQAMKEGTFAKLGEAEQTFLTRCILSAQLVEKLYPEPPGYSSASPERVRELDEGVFIEMAKLGELPGLGE